MNLLSYSAIDEVWPDFNKKPVKKKKIGDPICNLYENNDDQLAKYASNNFNKAKFQRNESNLLSQQRVSKPKNLYVEPEQNKYDITSGAPYIESEFEKQFALSDVPSTNKHTYDDDDVKMIINEHMAKTDTDLIDNNLGKNYTHDENTYEKNTDYIFDESSENKYHQIKPLYTIPEEQNNKNKYYKNFDDYIDEKTKISAIKSNKFAILDIILYIVSGIILIFLLEQFVRIGTLLN